MVGFIDEGFVPIFDHVLGSGASELLDHVGPFGSVFFDVLEDDDILVLGPVTMDDSLIEMILPSFPALFGSFEELSSGVNVEIFGYLIPLSMFEMSIVVR